MRPDTRMNYYNCLVKTNSIYPSAIEGMVNLCCYAVIYLRFSFLTGLLSVLRYMSRMWSRIMPRNLWEGEVRLFFWSVCSLLFGTWSLWSWLFWRMFPFPLARQAINLNQPHNYSSMADWSIVREEVEL